MPSVFYVLLLIAVQSVASKNIEPSFWVYGEQYGQKLPPCETACHEHFQKVISIFFEAGNITKNMDTVCGYYADAMKCMAPLTHCSDDSFFIPMMSGVKYMCVEQREAFDVLIECIDATSLLVKNDCDAECQPATLVTGLAVKDTVVQSLDTPLASNGLNIGAIIEPHVGKIMFSEACRVSDCLFQCYKTKFNMLCEGTAGSILMEMLSRPLSTGHQPGKLSMPMFLNTFVGGLLPHTCSFISKKKGGLQIDKELDKEIKRMYKGRKRPSTIDFETSMGIASPDVSPFEAMQRAFDRPSPFQRLPAWEQKRPQLSEPFSPFNYPQDISDMRSLGAPHVNTGGSAGDKDIFSSGEKQRVERSSKPELHRLNVNEEIRFLVEKDSQYVIMSPAEKNEYVIECQFENVEDLEGSGSGEEGSGHLN